MATFHSSTNNPSVNDRLIIFVSKGSKGLIISLSTLVGNTSSLQDLVGMDIIIFSTSSSTSTAKLSKDLLVLCQEGLNLA